eukprot:gb/GFBE01017404.1/.p1 GENE.gb/GFBE01017404.1/~~gb/GFBE01017404.1/.p1  ORF type:complete len:416 (+),score=78.05 gb/GFBE01017404.1/:1-1248(+)
MTPIPPFPAAAAMDSASGYQADPMKVAVESLSTSYLDGSQPTELDQRPEAQWPLPARLGPMPSADAYPVCNLEELARDRHGSAFLQQRLEDGTEPLLQYAVEQLLPAVPRLARDIFGHSVVQKLFEVSTVGQRRMLAKTLEAEVRLLSGRAYGCRVVQTAVRVLPPDAQVQFTAGIRRHVMDLIRSMHGNFVIQVCIEQMPPAAISFIVEAVEERVELIASHVYGCRVVQRLLEHCPAAQVQGITQRLILDSPRLISDTYGNYVVRHVLEYGRVDQKASIIGTVSSDILRLGKDRCASNVAEKCAEVAMSGDAHELMCLAKGAFMCALLGEEGDHWPPIQQLLEDKYGRYIVQSALSHGSSDDRVMLLRRLQGRFPMINCRGGSASTREGKARKRKDRQNARREAGMRGEPSFPM